MKRRTNVALIALVVVGLSIPAVEYWRGETLQQLQACYREIPTAGRQCFVSPCGSMIWRRLGLAGISVAQMESTLGPANGCWKTLTVSATERRCVQASWSFFYLPRGSLGGGPNLVCLTGDGKTCRILFWLLTA